MANKIDSAIAALKETYKEGDKGVFVRFNARSPKDSAFGGKRIRELLPSELLASQSNLFEGTVSFSSFFFYLITFHF